MDLLRHARFFVAVSEHLHFGHAAQELAMAQPPLSQGIQRLEKHLGVRLFDRDARHVKLTAAGKELLPAARKLLLDADRWVTTAHAWSPEHHLRVGIASDLLEHSGGVLQTLNGLGLNPVPVAQPTTTLVQLARDGEVDIALIRHPVVTDGLLTGKVISKRFRLAPESAAHDLPVALPPRSYHPPAHDQLVDALRRIGHSGAVVEVESSEERRAWVAAGRAAELIPDDSARVHTTVEVRCRLVTGPLSTHRPEFDPELVMHQMEELLA